MRLSRRCSSSVEVSAWRWSVLPSREVSARPISEAKPPRNTSGLRSSLRCHVGRSRSHESRLGLVNRTHLDEGRLHAYQPASRGAAAGSARRPPVARAGRRWRRASGGTRKPDGPAHGREQAGGHHHEGRVVGQMALFGLDAGRQVPPASGADRLALRSGGQPRHRARRRRCPSGRSPAPRDPCPAIVPRRPWAR